MPSPFAYAWTTPEFAKLKKAFATRQEMTVTDAATLLRCNMDRARNFLNLIGVVVREIPQRGARIKLWALAADADDKWDDYLEGRVAYKAMRTMQPARRLVPLSVPTYPTGDPTHFDTDWLGRVIYRGPVKAKDSRFDLGSDLIA